MAIEYTVSVTYDLGRDLRAYRDFGPFTDRANAEATLTALAHRCNVMQATLVTKGTDDA